MICVEGMASGATFLEQRLSVLPALPRGLGRRNCAKRHEGQDAQSHNRSAARCVDASPFLDHHLKVLLSGGDQRLVEGLDAIVLTVGDFLADDAECR